MRSTPKPLAMVVAVVVAAALACTLGAAPAEAVTKRFGDAPDDVRLAQVQEDGSAGESQPAVGSGPDIRSVTVRHARRTVAVTVRVARFDRPAGDQVLQVALNLRGSNGQRRTVAFTEIDGRTGVEMYRESNLRRVCGTTLRTAVRYSESAGQFRAVFPRRCIGTPRLLRVGAVVAAGDAAAMFAAGSGDVAYDYAFRDGGEPSVRPTYSRWVRHG